MPILPALPEPVPPEEVAVVLAHAIIRLPGGPPSLVEGSGHHLVAALEAAGMHVVRTTAPGPQLTL